jgi:glutathione S-transferase
MTAVLVTIPFSHFCEKARWALERCGVEFSEDGHLPLFHYRAARRAGGRRTVPVLRTPDGKVLADSTEIVAWADAHRPGALIPDDAIARAAALALEDELDMQLGPATRRWAYAQLLPSRKGDALIVRGVPRWEALALRVVRPAAVRMMKRGLNITPEGVERSRAKIAQVFAGIGARLADGRRYLVNDHFTVADLTFASLATPILLPPELPNLAAAAPLLPPAARVEHDAWRATAAGQFALRLYREERAVHGTQ